MPKESGRDVTTKLAGVIKARRLSKGLSQESLADLAGRHRSFIGLIESGKRGLSVAALVDISHALGASASELLAQAEVGREGTATLEG